MLELKNYNQQVQLIVALGNIGKEYVNTRHNIGFMFSEIFAEYLDAQGYQKRSKKTTLYQLDDYIEAKIAILRPLTYMNDSGKALTDYLKNSALKNAPDYAGQILIVHDDLDLKVGTYKLQQGKAPKKHNGISSVEIAIGNTAKQSYRLRIGIENRPVGSYISGLDYVLTKFTLAEMNQLKSLFDEIIEKDFSFV